MWNSRIQQGFPWLRLSSALVKTIFCADSSSPASASAIFFASSGVMKTGAPTEVVSASGWSFSSSFSGMRATSSAGRPVLFDAARIQSALPRETWYFSAISAISALSVDSAWKTSVPTALVCFSAAWISAERDAFSLAFASSRASKEIKTVTQPVSIYPQAS